MTSCTSVDLPDPLTPVTQVSAFSGIATSTFFRLCSVAPSNAQPLAGAAPPHGRQRDRQLVPQVLRRQRPRIVHQLGQRAGEHDAAALLARAEPEVDEVVGDRDHVGIVLDDEHGVALVAELPQDGNQPQVVARVQADRRLVEHVERVRRAPTRATSPG